MARRGKRIAIVAAGLALALVAGFGWPHREVVWRRLWLPWPLPPQEVVAWTGNYAVDARSGRMLWAWGGRHALEESLRIDDRVILIGTGSEIECRDVVDGVVIWRSERLAEGGEDQAGRKWTQVFLVGDALLQVGDRTVRAMTAKSGGALWRFTLSVGRLPGSILPTTDGFLLQTQSTLQKRDLGTGALVWEKPCEFAAITLGDQHVVAASSAGLVCLRLDTGEQAWNVPPPPQEGYSRPTAAGPYVVARVGHWPFETACFDGATGKRLWSSAQEEPLAAALAPDGRHLLVALETWGARNPSLVALDTRSWSPVWSRPLIDRGVEMVFEGSAVYVGSYNRSSFDVAMYCLDVASGAGQWTADVRGIVVEHMAY